MNGFSDALLQTILNLHFGAAGSPFTAPANYYFALMTAAPTDNGAGGVEASGGSYARVTVANNSTNFPPSTLGTPTVVNGTAISWGTAGVAWGAIKGIAVYKHLTNTGSADFMGYIAKEFTVAALDTVTLPAGSLSISLA